MRLKPPPTLEDAYRHLSLNAVDAWGLNEAHKIDGLLRSIAAAMATVAALQIPDEVEPLFGEDIGLDLEVAP